jgi:hypothetical protein
VDIDFYNEIRALIILVSLPNIWEAMRMAVSNSARKSKLKFEDIQDLILSEDVPKRDSSESSCFGVALKLKTRGRGRGWNSGQGRSRSRKSRSEFGSGNQPECWNCGKTDHFKKNCKEPMKKTRNNSANVVTKEVHDALIISFNSPSVWRLTSPGYGNGDVLICKNASFLT